MSGPHLDQAGAYPSVREIDPTLVARIAAGYGVQAARERWHWLNIHTVGDLATEGRRMMSLGLKWEGPRPPRKRGPAPGWARARREAVGAPGPTV